MANLKSGLILGEDEHLVVELEAELWATSSNPIARLIGAVVKFINLILQIFPKITSFLRSK